VGGSDLENLVDRARGGERCALEGVLDAIRDDVYNLSIRMLRHPQDAEDATQEILVRVMTSLGSFRGEAAFSTWVYRIAANHLLTRRRRSCELEQLSFDGFAEDLATGLDEHYQAAGVDEALLEEEVKLSCTSAMLLCLDREHRLAYLLGEVFELHSEQAAFVLDVTPAAYRQRLARARARIRGFMEGNCGLVNPANPCRCSRRIGQAVKLGRLDPQRLLFAGHPRRLQVRQGVAEMARLNAAAAIYRSHPDYAAPERVVTEIGRILDGDAIPTLIGIVTPD
jgi:RNA polymerase sigma factor (sigma-70 family)